MCWLLAISRGCTYNKGIVEGYPFGGCAILWQSILILKVTPIYSNCKRVCALNLVIGEVSIGLPVSIQPDYIIVGGDINTDFRRRNSKLVVAFKKGYL